MVSNKSSKRKTHTPMIVMPDSIAESDRIGHKKHCDGLVRIICYNMAYYQCS